MKFASPGTTDPETGHTLDFYDDVRLGTVVNPPEARGLAHYVKLTFTTHRPDGGPGVEATMLLDSGEALDMGVMIATLGRDVGIDSAAA